MTYDWITTELISPFPFAFSPRLVVDDTVLATGLSFAQKCFFSGPQQCYSVTGSSAGFMSLTDASFGRGNLAIDLGFNADGTLTGSIDEDGLNQNLHLAGAGFDWATTSAFFSDRYSFCGASSRPLCTISGYWLLDREQQNPVSEPSSIAIMAPAVMMAAMLIFGPGMLKSRRSGTGEPPL